MEYKWFFDGIFLYLSVLYLVGLFSGMQLNVINVVCVAISGGGFSAGQIGAAKTLYEKFHIPVTERSLIGKAHSQKW